MTIFLSPSKDLNFEPIDIPHRKNLLFPEKAQKLVDELRGFSISALEKLMHISNKLAELNHLRYQNWKEMPDDKDIKAALFAFSGDVYIGFDAKSMGKEAVARAESRLLILSGLYGLLRPLDGIQPYRLEMGRKIFPDKKLTLPLFWKSALENYFATRPSEFYINLASQEYSEAIPKNLAPFYNIHFLDEHKGDYIVKGFFAKKARGAFARALCEREDLSIEIIKKLDAMNYHYNQKLSTEFDLVFTR